MSGKGVDGVALGLVALGSVSIYSGLFNTPYKSILQSVLKGQQPKPGPPETFATTAGSSGGVTSSSGGSAAPGDTGASTATAKSNQAIGRMLAAPYGWSAGQQWEDLVSLWNKESGWNNHADNPASGAYGIAQALPPTKYPLAGQEAGGSSASAQIAWGLSYIKGRYGSPSAAWAHETADNWY